MFDHNNDGRLDIAVTNGFELPSTTLDDEFAGVDSLQLFQNEGRDLPMRELSKEAGFHFDGMGRGLVVFDFDKDGDEDVIVTENVGAPRFFKNNNDNNNNWINIRPMHKWVNLLRFWWLLHFELSWERISSQPQFLPSQQTHDVVSTLKQLTSKQRCINVRTTYVFTRM